MAELWFFTSAKSPKRGVPATWHFIGVKQRFWPPPPPKNLENQTRVSHHFRIQASKRQPKPHPKSTPKPPSNTKKCFRREIEMWKGYLKAPKGFQVAFPHFYLPFESISWCCLEVLGCSWGVVLVVFLMPHSQMNWLAERTKRRCT